MFINPFLITLMTLMLTNTGRTPSATFGDDFAYLQKYVQVVLLSDPSEHSQVAVVPAMQGRVMTSTTGGFTGPSFGWINRELIGSENNNLHINAYGGEDRFWMGPEGGQFSIFFKPGDPFDLEHWFTPPSMNEEAYQVMQRSRESVSFRKEMRLLNYSQTEFRVRLDREVRLLGRADVERLLGLCPGSSVQLVAFESNNTITNTGPNPWQKQSGLLSMWILGMFNPSPGTTVVVPFVPGDERMLGRIVNDEYFGKVPSDRLIIGKGVLFFKADGQQRSKIGLSKARAKGVLGSYDAANRVLTLVQYTLPAGRADYVNSMWRIQEDPYSGDAVNSYNDGPPTPGAKPMGPFYELETSSPAAALAPAQTLTHTHRTIHFTGDEKELDDIARRVLGVSLAQITGVFVQKP